MTEAVDIKLEATARARQKEIVVNPRQYHNLFPTPSLSHQHPWQWSGYRTWDYRRWPSQVYTAIAGGLQRG